MLLEVPSYWTKANSKAKHWSARESASQELYWQSFYYWETHHFKHKKSTWNISSEYAFTQCECNVFQNKFYRSSLKSRQLIPLFLEFWWRLACFLKARVNIFACVFKRLGNLLSAGNWYHFLLTKWDRERQMPFIKPFILSATYATRTSLESLVRKWIIYQWPERQISGWKYFEAKKQNISVV